MDRAKGIDVSRWCPVKDWNAVAKSGVTFVGMKATEGQSTLDPTLRTHRDAFRQQPFLLGIYYHFARSGKPQDQAERLLDAVGPLKDNERLALDFEVMVTTHPQDGLEWIDQFYQIIRAEYPDRPPFIYTSDRIWRQLGSGEDEGPNWEHADDVDLWAPRYNNFVAEPVVPRPWKNHKATGFNGNGIGWTIWQWTDGGATGPDYETPGVGKCDANVFRGGDTVLAEYAKLSHVIIPGPPQPPPQPAPIVIDSPAAPATQPPAQPWWLRIMLALKKFFGG